MIIRPATPGDVPAIVRLINTAFQVEQFFITGVRTTEEECARHLAAEGTTILVAEPGNTPGGTIVGTVVIRIQGTRGYFGMLAIAPDRQGQGVGRRLIDATEDRARQRGCTTMEIRVVDLRRELPPLYEALGYRITGTAPFSEPDKLLQPARFLIMSKFLGAGPATSPHRPRPWRSHRPPTHPRGAPGPWRRAFRPCQGG